MRERELNDEEYPGVPLYLLGPVDRIRAKSTDGLFSSQSTLGIRDASIFLTRKQNRPGDLWNARSVG